MVRYQQTTTIYLCNIHIYKVTRCRKWRHLIHDIHYVHSELYTAYHNPDYKSMHALCTKYPVNTEHFYNICTMLDQRRRRWADVIQVL